MRPETAGAPAGGRAGGAGFRRRHAADLRIPASNWYGRRPGGFRGHRLPGPSAPILALILSGLPTDRFLFAGFLPNKAGPPRGAEQGRRRQGYADLLRDRAAAGRHSLADCAAVLGDRPAAVARELTKLYEEVRRGTLTELARHYAGAGPPRGEIVLVIGPPGAEARETVDLDDALHAMP